MEFPGFREARESGPRRNRVTCTVCAQSVEIGRLREHLRAEHNLATSAVEERYLAAMMEIRKSRRGRP